MGGRSREKEDVFWNATPCFEDPTNRSTVLSIPHRLASGVFAEVTYLGRDHMRN